MNVNRAGLDAPANEDLLGRWPLARAISSVLTAGREGYSVRVGLYGPWGSGKTSVLHFIEKLCANDGHLVVSISPWGHVDARTLWVELASKLVAKLTEQGLQVEGAWKTSKVVGKVANFGKRLADAHQASKAAFAAADPLLSDVLTFTTEELKKATSSLGRRRLIVFVDDLDRADPKLLPHVMFAMREVLDIPGLSWVLAMDPGIVTKALADYHPGFGAENGDFLEKITEFRFAVAEPTAAQCWRLVERDLASEVTLGIDPELIRQELDVLPRNPRALRSFLRHLSALSPELNRYGDDEIDSRLLLLVTLLRSEFPALAHELLRNDALLQAMSLGYIRGLRDDDQAAHTALQSSLRELSVKLQPFESDSALRLVSRISSHGFWTTERFRHHIALLDHAPALTGLEFRAVDKHLTPNAVIEWVARWAAQRRYDQAEIYDALLDRAFGAYDSQLQRASDAPTEDVLASQMTAATDAFRFIEKAVSAPGTSRRAWVQPSRFSSFLDLCSSWAHFGNMPVYQAARQRERELLLELAASPALDPLQLLAGLEPWRIYADDEHDPRGPEAAKLKKDVLAVIERRAAAVVVAWFGQRTRIGAVLANKSEAAARFLIFRADSALWSGAERENMRRMLAQDDPVVADNAADVFRRVASGSPIRDEIPREEVEGMARDSEIMTWLWEASTRRRPNIRRWSSFYSQRNSLRRSAGLELSDPAWWPDALAHLGALGMLENEEA